MSTIVVNEQDVEDTLVPELKIWQGTEQQIIDAIDSGDIDDNSISVATDVEFVKPSEIGNGVLTIKKNGTTIGTFSANAKQDVELGFAVVDNVQPDWNQTNPNAEDYIHNKPTISTITVKRFE